MNNITKLSFNPLIVPLLQHYTEDTTCLHVDMNFIFSCSTPYLTRSLRSLVRYRVEHSKIKFISTSGHVIFCSLYKHTNNNFFDNFPKISDHFPKISQDFRKLFRRLDERFRTFSEHFTNTFRRLPTISEGHRRFPRRDRRCSDHTATHLSTFLNSM